MKKAILCGALVMLAGCAKHANEIPTAYVSPLQYKDYDCDQVAQEMEAVSRRVTQLTGSINKNADGDAAVMGVGLVLFWPALFFIDGDSPEAQEYGRMKGEFEALEKIAIRKKCDIDIQEIRPKEPAKQEPTKADAPAYPKPKR